MRLHLIHVHLTDNNSAYAGQTNVRKSDAVSGSSPFAYRISYFRKIRRRKKQMVIHVEHYC